MRQSTFVTSDDLTLNYREWDGSGLGFVMVHGLASNAMLWDQLAEGLSLAGYRSAALDQRGHGLSDRPSDGYDYGRVCQDLDEFIALLNIVDFGWHKPILVGQSWGCSVVEEYARRYPNSLSGLVLVDGGFSVMQRAFPTWEECEKQLAPPRFNGLSWTELEGFIRTAHADWPEQGIEATLANMEITEDGSARARLPFASHMDILYHLWRFNPVEAAPEITVPTVFITALNETMGGSAKKREDVAEVRSHLKGASAEYWITGDHDLHAQHPEQLREIITSELTQGVLK